MANLFSGKSGAHGIFPTASGASGPHNPHGLGGLIENFASDVKDSVIGLPTGVVSLAEHPERSVKQMAAATWQTWSPLFHGHFEKFGHNVYEHPLAPLLDIASVFDLGVGVAGKLGKVTQASDASLLGKAAKLTSEKRTMLEDPTGKRHDVPFNYSTRPLRRLTQEHVLPVLKSALPQNAQTALTHARYESAFFQHMAHRVAAKSVAMSTMMLAGKALTDPETAPIARSRLAARAWLNLYRHAPAKMTPDEAVPWLMQHTEYRPVKDPALMNASHRRLLRSLRSQESRWEKHRAANVELADSLPKIRQELDSQNALLKEMHDKGYHIVMPAKTGRKEPTERQLMERNAAPVKEVEANIKRLEQQLNKAHTARKIHDRAVTELSTLKSQRMDAERRSFEEQFNHLGSSEESFNSYAQHLGRHATSGWSGSATKAKVEAAVSRAAVGSDGMIRIVPKHTAKMLGKELSNSSSFVKWFYRKPTQVWKLIQVGYTPRTVTNNSVGNMAIYMMREHPVSGAWGLWTALKVAHGSAKAGQDVMKATAFKRNHWMFKHFSTELNNVFGHELLNQTGKTKALKGGFYPLVHKLADEPIRMAAISSYLKRSPEVRELMKGGKSFDQAATKALKDNPGLVERAADHARSIAGDYQTLRPWEERLRNIAPFYLWDRHILRSTKNLVADTPARAAMVQQISEMGKGETEKLLGDLPEFLQGAIPLQLLGIGQTAASDRDRASILETQSLNPFATIAELAGLGQAVTVGHNVNPGNALFSQVNPILTGAVSYGMGTNLLTGAPQKQHGGVVTSILSDLGTGLPEYRIAQGMLAQPTTVTPTGKEKMFAVDRQSAVSSFLGVPLRNVSKTATAEAARKERGEKKGRKRKNTFL